MRYSLLIVVFIFQLSSYANEKYDCNVEISGTRYKDGYEAMLDFKLVISEFSVKKILMINEEETYKLFDEKDFIGKVKNIKRKGTYLYSRRFKTIGTKTIRYELTLVNEKVLNCEKQVKISVLTHPRNIRSNVKIITNLFEKDFFKQGEAISFKAMQNEQIQLDNAYLLKKYSGKKIQISSKKSNKSNITINLPDISGVYNFFVNFLDKKGNLIKIRKLILISKDFYEHEVVLNDIGEDISAYEGFINVFNDNLGDHAKLKIPIKISGTLKISLGHLKKKHLAITVLEKNKKGNIKNYYFSFIEKKNSKINLYKRIITSTNSKDNLRNYGDFYVKEHRDVIAFKRIKSARERKTNTTVMIADFGPIEGTTENGQFDFRKFYKHKYIEKDNILKDNELYDTTKFNKAFYDLEMSNELQKEYFNYLYPEKKKFRYLHSFISANQDYIKSYEVKELNYSVEVGDWIEEGFNRMYFSTQGYNLGHAIYNSKIQSHGIYYITNSKNSLFKPKSRLISISRKNVKVNNKILIVNENKVYFDKTRCYLPSLKEIKKIYDVFPGDEFLLSNGKNSFYHFKLIGNRCVLIGQNETLVKN